MVVFVPKFSRELRVFHRPESVPGKSGDGFQIHVVRVSMSRTCLEIRKRKEAYRTWAAKLRILFKWQLHARTCTVAIRKFSALVYRAHPPSWVWLPSMTAVEGHSILTSKHEYCFHTRTNKILSNAVRFVLDVSIIFFWRAS